MASAGIIDLGRHVSPNTFGVDVPSRDNIRIVGLSDSQLSFLLSLVAFARQDYVWRVNALREYINDVTELVPDGFDSQWQEGDNVPPNIVDNVVFVGLLSALQDIPPDFGVVSMHEARDTFVSNVEKQLMVDLTEYFERMAQAQEDVVEKLQGIYERIDAIASDAEGEQLADIVNVLGLVVAAL